MLIEPKLFFANRVTQLILEKGGIELATFMLADGWIDVYSCSQEIERKVSI